MQPKKLVFSSLYPFKHWFATIILGPIFLYAIQFIKSPSHFTWGDPGILIVFVIFGFFFSFPNFVVYYFLYHILTKRFSSIILIKSILIVESILGLFVTLYFTDLSPLPEFYLPYIIAIIIGGLPFKVKVIAYADSKSRT